MGLNNCLEMNNECSTSISMLLTRVKNSLDVSTLTATHGIILNYEIFTEFLKLFCDCVKNDIAPLLK